MKVLVFLFHQAGDEGECVLRYLSGILPSSTQAPAASFLSKILCGVRSSEILDPVSDGTIVVPPSFAEDIEIVVVTIGGGKFGDMGDATAVEL